MISLLVGSFFFIGVFTYYNFKRQNQNYHENRLLRKEASTLSSIKYYVQSHPIKITSNDDIKGFFKNKIYEWEDTHRLDISIYNLGGELILCSNEKLVTEGIISGAVNQIILEELTNQKVRIKHRLNHLGVDYLNSYQYIFNQEGKPLAIISIPYFELDENYKRDLRSYLIVLSFVYFILFVLASVLAFLIARQITGPMNKLSENMKKATLKKKYIPLKWDSSDEVGQLVQQYNYMGNELEKNALTLAKKRKRKCLERNG
jgi:methyl-accepting chemotaxis protein